MAKSARYQSAEPLPNRDILTIDKPPADYIDISKLRQRIARASEVEIRVEVDLHDRSHAMSLRRNTDPKKYERKFMELFERIKSLPPSTMSFNPENIRFYRNNVQVESSFPSGDTKQKTFLPRSSTPRNTGASSNPFPRIGAFEIVLHFRGSRINSPWRQAAVFSKLDTGHWPNMTALVEQIGEMVSDPLGMISCATCAFMDWSSAEQRKDLVNTFFKITAPFGPDGVADCPICIMDDWNSSQQTSDLVNFFFAATSFTGVMSDFCECPSCSRNDWSVLQQRSDLVNTLLQVKERQPKAR